MKDVLTSGFGMYIYKPLTIGGCAKYNNTGYVCTWKKKEKMYILIVTEEKVDLKGYSKKKIGTKNYFLDR